MLALEETLFVLETFALDRGMHVVFRGDHGLVENGKIAHRFAGPAPLIERLSPLPQHWEAAIAAALTECPLRAPEGQRALGRRSASLTAFFVSARAPRM